MAKSDLPSPSSTITYFLLTTICFAFFIIYNIFQKEKISEVVKAPNNNLINSIYILLLVVGSYFINASISKAMCTQSIQWSYILMITLLPWIIIFISLYVMLKLFPGWISPFSNTIGYSIIGFLGIEKTYEAIFKTSAEESGENSEVVKAIANMNSNKSKFINQISTDVEEFKNFFINMPELLKDGIVEEARQIIIPRELEQLETVTKDDGPDKGGKLYRGGALVLKARSYISKKTHLYKKNLKGGGEGDGETESRSDLSSEAGEPRETIKNPLLTLYQLLIIKQVIGKIVWYVLAGILISSISYNLVINMACEKSLEEIQKDFETAREEQSTAVQYSDVNTRTRLPTQTF
jgi:hypothetical protein